MEQQLAQVKKQDEYSSTIKLEDGAEARVHCTQMKGAVSGDKAWVEKVYEVAYSHCKESHFSWWRVISVNPSVAEVYRRKVRLAARRLEAEAPTAEGCPAHVTVLDGLRDLDGFAGEEIPESVPVRVAQLTALTDGEFVCRTMQMVL